MLCFVIAAKPERQPASISKPSMENLKPCTCARTAQMKCSSEISFPISASIISLPKTFRPCRRRGKSATSAGTSYEEIMESGRLGCAHCYETFAHELARSIEKIHGKSKHIGKVPRSASGTIRKKNRLTELKMELNRAIAEQDFEQAAQLRDQIRAIEGEGDAK